MAEHGAVGLLLLQQTHVNTLLAIGTVTMVTVSKKRTKD